MGGEQRVLWLSEPLDQGILFAPWDSQMFLSCFVVIRMAVALWSTSVTCTHDQEKSINREHDSSFNTEHESIFHPNNDKSLHPEHVGMSTPDHDSSSYPEHDSSSNPGHVVIQSWARQEPNLQHDSSWNATTAKILSKIAALILHEHVSRTAAKILSMIAAKIPRMTAALIFIMFLSQTAARS